MHQTRRRWLCTALATGSVAALSGHVRAASVLPPVSIALTARYSLYHLPLMLAERLGFFRQQGLQVTLVPHESGHAAQAGLVQGKTDVLAGAFEHVLELQQRGLPFQAFAQITATPMLSGPAVVSPRATPSILCGPVRQPWVSTPPW